MITISISSMMYHSISSIGHFGHLKDINIYMESAQSTSSLHCSFVVSLVQGPYQH